MARTRGGHKNGDRAADRCGNDGVGTPSGRLARRLKAYAEMSKGRSFDGMAFHKPGSNKK